MFNAPISCDGQIVLTICKESCSKLQEIPLSLSVAYSILSAHILNLTSHSAVLTS